MGVDLYLEQRCAMDMVEKQHIDPLTKKPFYGTFEDWAYHRNGGHNLDKYLGYYSDIDDDYCFGCKRACNHSSEPEPKVKSKYEILRDGIETTIDKTPDYYLNFIKE